MKNAIYLQLLVVLFACSKKESSSIDTKSPKITVEMLDVEQLGTATEDEIVVKSSVKNISNEVVTVKWKRILKNVSVGWEMAVCDTNACYFPQVDSAYFEIPPFKSAKLSAYFYPDSKTGQGVAQIKIYAISQPSLCKVIEYKAIAQ